MTYQQLGYTVVGGHPCMGSTFDVELVVLVAVELVAALEMMDGAAPKQYGMQ